MNDINENTNTVENEQSTPEVTVTDNTNDKVKRTKRTKPPVLKRKLTESVDKSKPYKLTCDHIDQNNQYYKRGEILYMTDDDYARHPFKNNLQSVTYI